MRDLLIGLLEPTPVLDHGFVRLVDAMPRLAEPDETADHAIVRAARVSYQAGTKASRTDRGLIRYLMRNYHTSPFEMVEFKFHTKMPIFVARQWVRHRTASINEVSARYSVLPEEFYIPEPEAVGAQATSNRQGRSEGLLDGAIVEETRNALRSRRRAPSRATRTCSTKRSPANSHAPFSPSRPTLSGTGRRTSSMSSASSSSGSTTTHSMRFASMPRPSRRWSNRSRLGPSRRLKTTG